MRPTTLPILALLSLSLFACQSSTTGPSTSTPVPPNDKAVLPVAVWSQFIQVDQQARPTHLPAPGLVKTALEHANIKAVVDDNGVSVAPADADHARLVLLTDPTLKDSGVSVILAVPAGSSQLTLAGLIIPPPVTVPQ